MEKKWVVLLVLLGIVITAGIVVTVWWLSKPDGEDEDETAGDSVPNDEVNKTLAQVAANQAAISDNLVDTMANVLNLNADVSNIETDVTNVQADITNVQADISSVEPRVDALETFRTITETPKLYRRFYTSAVDSSFVAGQAVLFGGVQDSATGLGGSTNTATMQTGEIRCATGDNSVIIVPENKNWSCTLTVEGATERGNFSVRPYFFDSAGGNMQTQSWTLLRIDAAGASNQGSFNSTHSITFTFSSWNTNARRVSIGFSVVDESSPRTVRFVGFSIREM
jgi:flagellar basal body-associated protein FliL